MVITPCPPSEFNFNNVPCNEGYGQALKNFTNMKKLLLSLAVAVALVSCGGGKPSPTGDAEKDAKALAEYLQKGAESCNSFADFKKFGEESEKVLKEFQDYAEKDAEYGKAMEAQEAAVAPALEAVSKKGMEFAEDALKELAQ